MGTATFTMALKKVVEVTGGTTEFVNGNTRLIGGNIGIAHYPIFDEAYRERLNGLILDHYWNQEIGVESVDMFQLAMRRKLNEIMPQYNLLYQSQRMAFDPLKTIDIHIIATSDSTQTGESIGNAEQVSETIGDNTQNTVNAGTSDTETDSASKSRVVASETPQTFLSGNGDYATSANDVNGSTNTGSTGSESSTSDITANTIDNTNASTSTTAKTEDTQNRKDETHTSGYNGVASDLIMRYRKSLINIDLMVIADLAECFMLINGNGDEYSNNYTNGNRYY